MFQRARDTIDRAMTPRTTRQMSDTFYDRFRLVALIAAIEDDLRRHLRRDVAPWNEVDQLFGARLSTIVERAAVEGVHDATSEVLLDYIDFGDGFTLLNAHRATLSDGLAVLVRSLTPRFEAAVGIRNRVLHGRPYRSSDEDDLAALGRALADADAEFPRTAETLQRLERDPNWSPIVELQAPASKESPTLLTT
jgi:LuxR family transcriptional regulator, glucitol operon activator